MSKEKPKIFTFKDAYAFSKQTNGDCADKRRLLLGNGFSMACDTAFGYKALYTEVKKMGISEEIQKIFDKFGETNFEAILTILDNADWMASNYKMKASDPELSMRTDYEILKKHLAEAICNVHPTHSAVIADEKYEACYNFIEGFDSLYTTNYDLLLYWASLRREPFKFSDGFYKDEDTEGNDCEYMPHHPISANGIYFLHGALHLYSNTPKVRKRVWKDTNSHLTTQIREALDNKQYPLVVAEGSSSAKLAQIESSSYLSDVWRKFRGTSGHLFIFGSSLSESDQHVLDAIAKNIEIRHVWIGIRGDFNEGRNERFLGIADSLYSHREAHLEGYKKLKKREGDLDIHFYDSDSVNIWAN